MSRAKDGSIANYDVKLDTSGATKRFNVGDIMLDAQQKSLLEKRSIISKRSKEEINHACLVSCFLFCIFYVDDLISFDFGVNWRGN